MASACVTMSPRISFTHDDQSDENVIQENSDLELFGSGFSDFEFRLQDPVTMLPADELFSDGKLVPLQLNNNNNNAQQQPVISVSSTKLPDNIRRRTDISATDPYLFSPKAPTCSIHWKQLLRLKKLYQKTNNGKEQEDEEMNKMENGNKNAVRSLRNFLPRSSKNTDSSINVPLLKENEVSISMSRLSLSSSTSSSHEVEETPRLSLDSDKPSNKCGTNTSLPRLKVAKLKQKSALSTEKQARGNPIRRVPEISEPVQHVVSAESPRMNPSGKIVFQSLERSSSSPSTFNGAPRYKHRGVERSYSEKVRITPVLNVPVGSLSRSGVFGIPLFSSSSSSSSQQKKERVSTSVGGSRIQQSKKSSERA